MQEWGRGASYCTVLDQAEVSPDSKPSVKITPPLEYRCPWMLLALLSVPSEPSLSQTTMKLLGAPAATAGLICQFGV